MKWTKLNEGIERKKNAYHESTVFLAYGCVSANINTLSLVSTHTAVSPCTLVRVKWYELNIYLVPFACILFIFDEVRSLFILAISTRCPPCSEYTPFFCLICQCLSVCSNCIGNFIFVNFNVNERDMDSWPLHPFHFNYICFYFYFAPLSQQMNSNWPKRSNFSNISWYAF